MADLEARVKALEAQIARLSTTGVKKVKRTRPPSKYNIFVKAAMPQLKERFPGLKQQELLKLAAQEYNKQKQSQQPSS